MIDIDSLITQIPAQIKVWSQFAHPLLMWVLLGLTFYALYLGIQIRRTRAAEGDLKKELIKGKFTIRHHQAGSILLALMVLGTIGAMVVTYINSGKLFLGSHLLVGLGMTGLIATSASLTPYMQKGHNWARYSHIGLNMVLTGLFLWQAGTGIQIVQRIISKM
jgi:MFS family permease